jgi:hypothetical protein
VYLSWFYGWFFSYSKVHITKDVLEQLGSNHQFTVENGDGQKRNEYLREKNIETFILSVKEQVSIEFHDDMFRNRAFILGYRIVIGMQAG